MKNIKSYYYKQEGDNVRVNSNSEHPPGQTPGICFKMSTGDRAFDN